MSIVPINLGQSANDGTGEPLREGGQKINSNFAELDTRTATAQNTASSAQNTASSALSKANAAEPYLGASSSDAVLLGNRTWTNLASAVRSTVLSGLSLVTNGSILATDTILVALGKLQNRLNSLGSSANATLVANSSDTTAGRVLTVGYGGLGYADNAPTAGTGLNPDNFRTGQHSIFGQFALGTGWGTRTGWLSVFPGDANNVAQTFTSGDSERWSLQRVQSGGTWSDWSQPFAQALNKGAFNANNLPPGSNWTVTGVDSQAASNNWPVIAAGNASTAVWWNISTQGISNRTTQIATQAYNGNNGVTFIRSKHDATWSAWQEVYTPGNVTRDAQAGGILSSASIGGWRLTKYRNGMFLCSRSHPNFAMGANGTTRSNFTLPITAAYTPECSVIVTGIPEASDDWYGVTAKALDSTTTGFFKVRNGATPQQLQQINVTVIGFWN